MAEDINVRTGIFGTYYAVCNNEEQRQANALYIYKYLTNNDWTLNAIAGLLGNIQAECGLSPGAEEKLGSGFGLIQWTPGSIHKNWCTDHGYSDATTMDANLAHIVDEAKNETSWGQKDIYTLSYSDFAKSTETAYYLACAYAWNRERSGVVLYGFNTNNHSAYCVDESSPRFNVACRQHYAEKYGEAAAEAQAEINRQTLIKDKRGGWAEEWYSYLSENTFEARLEKDSSVLKSNYWKARAHGGLNYNTAVIDWPRALQGATQQDLDAIAGTYTTLPNCTSWAWGRIYEITGQEPPIFSGDAGNWWNYFDEYEADFKAKGYYKSKQPALGAIACWQDPNNRASMGHVAIVEAINKETGTISFSESGFQWWNSRPSYFSVQKNINPADCYYTKSPFYYQFMGYINLPGGVRQYLPTIDSFKLLKTSTESADFELIIGGHSSVDLFEVSCNVNGTERKITVSSGTNKITIDNLVPNTKYSVKILINANGTTIESPEITVDTVQDYPEHMKKVSIQALGEDLKTTSFRVTAEKPDNLGYWHKIGNKSGYRIYTISDYKLLGSFDSDLMNSTFTITPNNNVYGTNFQIGIIPWVTDNKGLKVFALPGEEFPVGSNSIYLKNASEISDSLFLVLDNKVSKVNPYARFKNNIVFKPLNIFKLK
jgi:surface antigen